MSFFLSGASRGIHDGDSLPCSDAEGEHTARRLTRSWQVAVRRGNSETQGAGSADAGATGTASDNEAGVRWGGTEEFLGSVDDIRWGLQGCWAVKRRPLGIAGLLSGSDAAHRNSQGSWAVSAMSVRGRAVGRRRCHSARTGFAF